MPGVNATDILDLVNGTLRDLGRLKFTQIAQDLQNYEIMGNWLKKERVSFESGIGVERTIMDRAGQNASHVKMFEDDVVNVYDHTRKARHNWVHAQTNWAIERREIAMNRGEALVFKVIEPRRQGAMIAMAEILEDAAWSVPAVGDASLPNGIPYYIVYAGNGATVQGFHGPNPGAHTTTADINRTTVPKWRNYSINYTTVSKDDLIAKMRTGKRKMGWKPAVPAKDYAKGSYGRYVHYVDEPTIAAFETVGEQQNENLGRDLAWAQDEITIHRAPIRWVPKLDVDNLGVPDALHRVVNPVYSIDHSVFHVNVLSGDYLEESAMDKRSGQHNTLECFVDLTYNYFCDDPRRCGVYSTGAGGS